MIAKISHFSCKSAEKLRKIVLCKKVWDLRPETTPMNANGQVWDLDQCAAHGIIIQLFSCKLAAVFRRNLIFDTQLVSPDKQA